MEIIRKDKVRITPIIECLKKDGLVIMPTETVYGAFVNATSKKAVEKLTKFKARPFGKPYSVAVADRHMAERFVALNETAKSLYKTFLPGPVTIISHGKHKVAPGVESETGTLGIRIPKYQLILDLVKAFDKPITATSANASYKIRPYKIADILNNLSAKQKALIDLIVDAGELPKNEPSTVIDTTLDDVVVLRQGDIKLQDTFEVLSRSPENTQNIAKELWQKYDNHYGQRALVFALEGEMGSGKTVFTKGLARALGVVDEVVSPTYNLEEEYDKGKLIHIDAWRMETAAELSQLGFAKRITDKSVLVVEWADRVSEEIRQFNEDAIIIWVKITYRKKADERLISWGINK